MFPDVGAGVLSVAIVVIGCSTLLFFDVYQRHFHYNKHVFVHGQVGKKRKKKAAVRAESKADEGAVDQVAEAPAESGAAAERGGEAQPAVIPFSDPVLAIGEILFALLTGRMRKMFSFDLMNQRNIESEEANAHCKFRQGSMLGRHLVMTWDADMYKEVINDWRGETYDKMMGLSPTFDRVMGKSIIFVKGEEWKAQRKLIHPAFEFDHVRELAPSFNKIARRLVASLRQSCDAPIEAMPYMSKAALDSLGLAGFGVDFDTLGKTEASGENDYTKYQEVAKGFSDPTRFIPGYERLPLKSIRRWQEAVTEYVDFLRSVIRKKKAEGREDTSDILDVLVRARGEADDTGLTEEELVQNVNVFFIAGHETTAATLAYALHMLEQNPDVQDHLRDEIDRVVGRNEEADVSFDDLKDMPYLDMFLKETMRLHPAAPGLIREVKQDTTLGGYQLVKGDLLMLCTYTMHRHPDYWVDPDKFWPERFSPENSRGRHPYAFTPFATGPRACVGKNFTMLEMRVILVHLVRSFLFQHDPNPAVPFSSISTITLRPAYGHTLLVKPIL